MIDSSTIGVFVGAAMVLLVIPGPAVLYIITRSIDQGRLAGVVSALGISAGTVIHVIAAALGLSAIIVSSALAFSLVKYIGAIYLIYLGLRELFKQNRTIQPQFVKEVKLTKVFFEGLMVNLLNPKTTIFMFAFLPQFVHVTNGSVGLQILLLGTILMALGLCSDATYALLAGGIKGWLNKHPAVLTKQKFFTGTVYIALGMLTALAKAQK